MKKGRKRQVEFVHNTLCTQSHTHTHTHLTSTTAIEKRRVYLYSIRIYMNMYTFTFVHGYNKNTMNMICKKKAGLKGTRRKREKEEEGLMLFLCVQHFRVRPFLCPFFPIVFIFVYSSHFHMSLFPFPFLSLVLYSVADNIFWYYVSTCCNL